LSILHCKVLYILKFSKMLVLVFDCLYFTVTVCSFKDSSTWLRSVLTSWPHRDSKHFIETDNSDHVILFHSEMFFTWIYINILSLLFYFVFIIVILFCLYYFILFCFYYFYSILFLFLCLVRLNLPLSLFLNSGSSARLLVIRECCMRLFILNPCSSDNRFLDVS